MTAGSFQPRRFGAHLLVAQLGEDCLGTVYRALHGGGERRFVRLRVLQSPELSPPAVFAAVARRAEQVSRLSHKTIVQHAEMSVVDGAPFVAWYEGAGWTLDTVLARLREAGTRLPVPYALLIAERVCAAVEHAWFSPFEGEPIRHGLLWPGFVSISNDAEIRLGGFGLADAILPTLSRGRLARDVSPYAAPEARETGCVGPHSDGYSAGVLLLELLTGRRPFAAAPVIDADDASEGVRGVLESCFAAPEERPTVLELHRAIQEQLAAGPAPVSSVDLALFLYTLLNPESRSVPRNDGESTNPISGDLDAPAALDTAGFGRRRTDGPLRTAAAPVPVSEASDPYPEVPSSAAALVPVSVIPPKRQTSRPSGGFRWLSGFAYFGAAAAIIIGVETLAIHRERGSASPKVAAASAASALQPAPAPEGTDAAPAQASIGAPASARQPGIVITEIGRRRPEKSSIATAAATRGKAREPRVSAADLAALRNAAERARFRAGWARIEAERREAGELAGEKFGAGRAAEAEGQRLLGAGQFAQALSSFEVAAALYREAENASRETRLERLRLSAPSS
ncbi:MAG TPA: protein kinase [Thermoanaerobaculia bacterium]|nr:protein kinase [Thermoanaerobaculia bacterium]